MRAACLLSLSLPLQSWPAWSQVAREIAPTPPTASSAPRLGPVVNLQSSGLGALANPLSPAGPGLILPAPSGSGVEEVAGPVPIAEAKTDAVLPEPAGYEAAAARLTAVDAAADQSLRSDATGRAGAAVLSDFYSGSGSRRDGGLATRADLSGPTGSNPSLARAGALNPQADSPIRAEPPRPDPKKGGWFGLGRPAVFFLAALAIGQVGVEAITAATPALSEETFGDFTTGAWLGILTNLGDSLGSTLSPLFIRKWGSKKAYLYSLGAMVVTTSVLSGLVAAGHITFPAMAAFYAVSGIFQGISSNVENSIPPALVGQGQDKLERYWASRQMLIESISVVAPIGTGMLVAGAGSIIPAMLLFPVASTLSMLLLIATLKIPRKLNASAGSDPQRAEAPTLKKVAAETGHALGRGARLVMKNPLLRTSFLAYAAYSMLNPLLYYVIAPAFGLYVVLGAAPLAGGVYTVMTGLYSFGGLVAGLLIMAGRRRDAAKALSSAQREEGLRRSMLSWMGGGILGLAAFTALLFPAPMMGSLSVVALAMIPFGVAQVGSRLKVKSFFQSKVEPSDMEDAMGFLETGNLIISSVGLMALIATFKFFSGPTPFIVFLAALIPVAVSYAYLRHRLSRLSAL